MSEHDPYYPGDALIEEANAFRAIAYSDAGPWIIAHAHELGGLDDGTIRAIRKLRDERARRIAMEALDPMSERLPDSDGWTRNRIAYRMHVTEAAVMLDMPWLVPDPNPFPRLSLFRIRAFWGSHE